MKLHGLEYLATLRQRIRTDLAPQDIMEIPTCLERVCSWLPEEHKRVVQHPTQEREIQVPVPVAWAAVAFRRPAMSCANPDELRTVKWYTTLYFVDYEAAHQSAPGIQQWHDTYRPSARQTKHGYGARTRHQWLGIPDIRQFAHSEAGGGGDYDARFLQKCGFASTLAGWEGDLASKQPVAHDRDKSFPPVVPFQKLYPWRSCMHALLYSCKQTIDDVSVQVLALMVATAQCRCGICNDPFTFSLNEAIEIDHMVPENAQNHQDATFRAARKTGHPSNLLNERQISPEMKYTSAVHRTCNMEAAAKWNSRPHN